MAIWDYAAAQGFVIVTKDADFLELALLRGPPPKVIFLRLGNCPTGAILLALERGRRDALEFELDPQSGVLVIGR